MDKGSARARRSAAEITGITWCIGLGGSTASENFLKRRTIGSRPAARRSREGGAGSVTEVTPALAGAADGCAGGGETTGGGSEALPIIGAGRGSPPEKPELGNS